MKNIGIYYRVSTDKQDLASQKGTVEKWIEELPLLKKPKKILVFKDEGISGKTTNRPGLTALMDAAFKGQIDTIVVYRLDRFSRNASTAIRMILSLDDAGVAFISVTQPVLNLGHENPFRRTMLAAFAEIAEIERDRGARRRPGPDGGPCLQGLNPVNQEKTTLPSETSISPPPPAGEPVHSGSENP
jgi:DNA invertase Pin-like site-specific DNA recombinase